MDAAKITRQDVKAAQDATYKMAKMLDDQHKKLTGQKTGILMAMGTASKDGPILEDQLKGVEAQLKGLNDQRSRAYDDLKKFSSVRKPAPGLPAPGGGTYDGGVDTRTRKWIIDSKGVTRVNGN